MKKTLIALIVLGIGVAYGVSLFVSAKQAGYDPDTRIINDVSRLNPTRILSRETHADLEGLQAVLAQARQQQLPVSIAGKQHSMGGHTFYEDGIVLDMLAYNKILEVGPQGQRITVQSGATWDDVIEAVHPHGLAATVLQDYSGFSVGGSMSVNVHQSDPHYGPMIETVESFRLLTADGEVRNVSREENEELFGLVIGGYGLFGVILDVTLMLTEDSVYAKDETIISVEEYDALFTSIQEQPEIENVFARLSIVPDETLLDELIVTTYATTDQDLSRELLPDDAVGFKKFVMGLSRSTNWGKRFRWYLQKRFSHIAEPLLVTRNNLDKQDFSFLDYYSAKDTDILQEYFVPRDQLLPFLNVLRASVQENDLNLLSATIRYVPKNTESVLSYSSKADELFGIVLYFNVPLSASGQEEVKRWTQELIDETLALNGTFYLPYELYATNEQVRQAYPRFDEFLQQKDVYDPDHLFQSEFYQTYAGQ